MNCYYSFFVMSVVLPKLNFGCRMKNRYCEELLLLLPKPTSIWKYLLAITQVPRGSNNDGERFRHKKILAFLKKQAEDLNCEVYVDKGENLLIRKPAFPGFS